MNSNNVEGTLTFDPAMKIKAEPGVCSLEESSKPIEKALNLLTSIKTEPQLLTSSLAVTSSVAVSGMNNTKRLRSFRVPRDLTLGGRVKLEKPKKVYTPNLNVQRPKDKEEGDMCQNQTTLKENKSYKGKEKTGINKTRDKSSFLMQSTGIFSEGIVHVTSPVERSGYTCVKDPREQMQNTRTIRKSLLSGQGQHSEPEELKDILKDDLVNIGQEFEKKNEPVTLPLSFTYLQNTAQRSRISVALEKNETAVPTRLNPDEFKNPLRVTEVIGNDSSDFMLLQFPDCFPGFAADDSLVHSKYKSNINVATGFDEHSNSKLNNLKEGFLGKLQILKSGETKLRLGDNDLNVDVGSAVNFRQDAAALRVMDSKMEAQLIHLGTVSNTLVLSPNWESILDSENNSTTEFPDRIQILSGV